MKTTDNTTPEIELAVIRKIMEDSRQVVANNGIHFIFWGILVSVCLFANYYMLMTKTALDKVGMMWAAAMTLGAIADGILRKSLERKQKVLTFGGRLLGSLWTASGIAMFMFGFLGPISGAYNPIYICPVISTMLGVSYMVSGSIQQLPWLRNIALGWWIGAAAMFFLPGRHTLLVFALMMLLLQVLPGILINRSNKKKNIELQQA
jgi:hypothetical protein